MATITVRKLEDKTVAALKARAVKSGVSMEEEVRRILVDSVRDEESAGELMLRIFSRSWDGEAFQPEPRCHPVVPLEFE